MALYLFAFSSAVLAALRFVNLNSTSLWTDEAISIYFAEDGILEAWFGRMLDYNPPLYDLLLYPFIELFGISEISVRVLSGLFGFASFAVLLYYLLRWDRLITAVAVILVGFSQVHFEYSREARPYVVLFFFAMWSALFLLRKLWRAEGWRRRDLGLLTIQLAALSYLHYSGLLFSGCVALILLLMRKQLMLRWTQVFIVWAGWGVCLLPWAETLLVHAQQTPDWIQGRPPQLGLVLERLSSFYLGSFSVAAALISCMLVAGFLLIWRRSPLRASFLFSFLLWVLPLVLTLFILYVVAPVQFYERHFFSVFPGLMMSLILSFKIIVDHVRSLERRQKIWQGGLLALSAVALVLYTVDFFKLNRWNMPSRLDARAGAKYILSQQLSCAPIIDSKYPGALNLYLRMHGSALKAEGPRTMDLDKISAQKCTDLFVVASICCRIRTCSRCWPRHGS